jgi:hypothetical protein
MSRIETAAKKHGKAHEWAKHLRLFGKRKSSKRIRRLPLG